MGDWGYARAPSSPSAAASHGGSAINSGDGGSTSGVFAASGIQRFGPSSGIGRASSRGVFTVLTIYSLMNGATLHVMPRLFYEAGILVGVVMTCLVGLLSWYTCGLIVQIGAYSTEYDDFSDCVGEYFEDASNRRCVGECGRYVALIVSIGMMAAVCLSYHFVIVSTIVEMLAENDQCGPSPPLWCSRWFWVSATSAFLFLLSYLQLRHQIRICVVGAICFLVGMALTIALDLTEINWNDFSKFNDILWYGESLNSLAGILFISFFVHNVVLPIVKSQRNPRPADLAVSYTAVGITYIVVGCFGALAYHERDEGGPRESRKYPVTDTCRDVAMILHAITFYPLMTVIYRQQVIGGLLRTQSNNSDQSDVAVSGGSPPNRGYQNGGGRPGFRPVAGGGPGNGGDAGGSGGNGDDGGKARQRMCGYVQTFIVTLMMVGFSGGVTWAYPELDKE
jgi:hypothetical protein